MNGSPYLLGIFDQRRDASKVLRRAVTLQSKPQRSEAEEVELQEIVGKLDHLGAANLIDLVAEALRSPLGLRT